MKITVIWWQAAAGTIARWNMHCFKEAGHDVIFQESNVVSPFTDFVFTSIPGLMLSNDKVPLVTQLGGYGRTLVMPGRGVSYGVKYAFERSILINILDPRLIEEGVKPRSAVLIPNAKPPVQLNRIESKNFYVFNPASGMAHIKQMDRFIKTVKIVGEVEPDIVFILPLRFTASYNGPIGWLKLPNLQIMPRLTYEQMMRVYAFSDIIAPFSAAEIQPQTFLEAMISGKPTVVDQIGCIFSVQEDEIESMIDDFGKNAGVFHRNWKGSYHSGAGKHYLRAKNAEELADIILELHSNAEARKELGQRGSDWIDRYAKWNLLSRGVMIVKKFEERMENE